MQRLTQEQAEVFLAEADGLSTTNAATFGWYDAVVFKGEKIFRFNIESLNPEARATVREITQGKAFALMVW